MCLKTDHTSSFHIHEVLFSEHLVKSQVSIGKIPGSLSAKNKSETGSSSSRVTLVVKLLRFLTVNCFKKHIHVASTSLLPLAVMGNVHCVIVDIR